ncbi:MAG: hypothetical protein JRD89_09315 [Deltaproteobacteria bacterium]|nr:hypothetical protein [Deltaproteobacteria bacterium]
MGYQGIPMGKVIKVPDGLYEKLKSMKVHPRETMGDVIERLVKEVEKRKSTR